jgi:hypothetical protein
MYYKMKEDKERSRITVKFGGDLKAYLEWNIESAARTFVSKPDEYDVTMAVYKIHREILANSGLSEERLQQGDDELVVRIESYFWGGQR